MSRRRWRSTTLNTEEICDSVKNLHILYYVSAIGWWLNICCSESPGSSVATRLSDAKYPVWNRRSPSHQAPPLRWTGGGGGWQSCRSLELCTRGKIPPFSSPLAKTSSVAPVRFSLTLSTRESVDNSQQFDERVFGPSQRPWGSAVKWKTTQSRLTFEDWTERFSAGSSLVPSLTPSFAPQDQTITFLRHPNNEKGGFSFAKKRPTPRTSTLSLTAERTPCPANTVPPSPSKEERRDRPVLSSRGSWRNNGNAANNSTLSFAF